MPPFAVLSATAEFRLPPFFHNVLDQIQYAAGIAISNTSLTISYGAADCAALATDLPIGSVRQYVDRVVPLP